MCRFIYHFINLNSPRLLCVFEPQKGRENRWSFFFLIKSHIVCILCIYIYYYIGYGNFSHQLRKYLPTVPSRNGRRQIIIIFIFIAIL